LVRVPILLLSEGCQPLLRVLDLGEAGLWLWNGGGVGQISGVNVDSLAAGDTDADGSDEVAADFGAAGLWLWDGGAWTQISGVNPD